MTKALIQGVVLVLGLAATGCREATNPMPGPLARVEVVAGDAQSAAAGTELAAPLVVKATDADGNLISGQVVNFVVVSGGGSLFAPTAQTNAEGIAQNLWTLGTTVGEPQKVEIRAVDATTGAPIIYATFTAAVTPGAPAQLQKVAGDAQSGSIGAPLPDSLTVKVVDRYGNAVPNATVTWTATDGGSMAPATSTTRADGTTKALWTIGTHASATATASVAGGTPANFTAFASVSPLSPIVVAKVSGDGQIVPVGTAFPQPLVVRVTLTDGRAVEGARVYFESFDVVTTSGDGLAQLGATASGAAGPRTFRAGFLVAPGTWLGTPVTFSLTYAPGAPASLLIQNKGINNNLGSLSVEWLAGTAIQFSNGFSTSIMPVDSLRARVLDAYGNPSVGATVTWSTTTGVVRPASSTVGADGMARTHFVAGLVFGRVIARTGTLADTGNVYASTPQTMSTPPSTGLTLVVGSGSLSLGAGTSASVVVQISNAYVSVDVDSDYLTWTSNNPAVATAATGAPGSPARATISAYAPGTATLTAAIGNVTGTIVVTVTP